MILLLTGYMSSFLAYVDLQGTTYSEPSIATGYGSMIALPLMRKALQQAPDGILTEEKAEEVLKTCMKVLFYRDARSINKVGLHSIHVGRNAEYAATNSSKFQK